MTEPSLTAVTIRSLRHRLGMTQEQFATYLGVHPMTVSRWERPGTEASPRHAPIGKSRRALLELLRQLSED